MPDKVRKLLTAALTVMLAVGLIMTVISAIDRKESKAAYENAVALASQPVSAPPPATQPVTEPDLPEEERPPQWVPAAVEEDLIMAALEGINLQALQQVNPDVVGWISIPQTQIHYPITQGEDNEYYLYHTWEHQSNFGGAIFLEAQCNRELTDFNTIIYGHNMRNGSMFTDLHAFADPQFAASHPYVYIVTTEGIWRYEIFASYEAPVDSKTYGLSFRQTKTREDFIRHALENSQIETGIIPQISDRILTLSTCTGDGYSARRVVQARLPMVLE